MEPFIFPSSYARVRRVEGFAQLASTPLREGINALCWERLLEGDYAEVVAQLGGGEGIVSLEEADLRALRLSPPGRIAVEQMLADLRLLRDLERAPVLNCIHGYPRDEEPGPVKTHVFSFHADSAPFEADTWLCTYYGPSSEGLRNEDALHKIDDPATRAELLRQYGGAEGEGFEQFLSDHCYDLHYAPLPGARPFSFGVGNLWRISVAYPDALVPPCVHRAPETGAGDPARLLLIS